MLIIHGFNEKFKISQLAAACNPATLTRTHGAPPRYGHGKAVCKRFATKVTGSRNRAVCSAHVWDGREHSILGQRPRPDGRPEDGAGVPGRGTRAEEGR